MRIDFNSGAIQPRVWARTQGWVARVSTRRTHAALQTSEKQRNGRDQVRVWDVPASTPAVGVVLLPASAADMASLPTRFIQVQGWLGAGIVLRLFDGP